MSDSQIVSGFYAHREKTGNDPTRLILNGYVFHLIHEDERMLGDYNLLLSIGVDIQIHLFAKDDLLYFDDGAQSTTAPFFPPGKDLGLCLSSSKTPVAMSQESKKVLDNLGNEWTSEMDTADTKEIDMTKLCWGCAAELCAAIDGEGADLCIKCQRMKR